ncbi:MAG: type II toxin-antitoxin system HicB family antitoxin [Lachnospiraceae bacterium]|nr:type II toxin-antitoxin system HicB family antitoxin [Lachnospiraceae bacterium]
MKSILEYKGYCAKIQYSADDGVLFGKIEGINDLVNFESENAKEIEREFQGAVDDYLEFCEEIGKQPDKTYKGTFNVRIAPELHRELSMISLKTDKSLNQVVEEAIKLFVSGESKTEITLCETVTTLSNALVAQNLSESTNTNTVRINSNLFEHSTFNNSLTNGFTLKYQS